MINKFLNKISFIRLTGIKRFLFLEVYPAQVKMALVLRKEKVYKINRSHPDNFQIIASKEIHFFDETFKNEISAFLKENNIKEVYTIVSVSDYKVNTIAVPVEITNTSTWLNENTDRFLPQGCNQDDFCFSYELLSMDDTNNYYVIAIARKDYIERITENICTPEIKIIAIAPILLTPKPNGGNGSSLSISIINNNIYYSFISKKTALFESVQKETDSSPEEIILQIIAIKSRIDTIIKFEETTPVYIACRQEETELVTKLLKNEVGFSNINNEYGNNDPYYINCLRLFDNLIRDFRSRLNLNIYQIAANYQLERKVVNNVVLSIGALLLFLMLFLTVVENTITSKIGEKEEYVLEVKGVEKRQELLQHENDLLIKKSSLIKSMKKNNFLYTLLFYNISGITNNNVKLTELKTIPSKDGNILVELKGKSKSQGDIADILNKIEMVKRFTFAKLISSIIANKEDQDSSASIQYDFNISFNSNDH